MIFMLNDSSQYLIFNALFLQPFEEEEGKGNPDMVNRDAPGPPPSEQVDEAPPDDDEDEQSEMERQLKQMQEQVSVVLLAI